MASQYDDQPTESTDQSPSPNRRPIWRAIFDGTCILLLTVSIGYVGWFGISATRSVTRSLAGPETVVRLQIVNGTADPTLAKSVAGVLCKSADHLMSFAVVDTTDFSARKVARSFLIARGEDPAAARLVARRFGLSADRITMLPLEHNNRNVLVTLVLGDDYRTLVLSPGIGKETDRRT